MKIKPHHIKEYSHFYNMSTRWKDNDVYSHINNVVYYEYFDTAVNTWLIENKLLDYKNGDQIGYIVQSGCNYFSPISHPCELVVGIRVSSIGNSSVKYEAAVFKKGTNIAAAQGFFTHVYVNRKTQKSSKLPPNFRELLRNLKI